VLVHTYRVLGRDECRTDCVTRVCVQAYLHSCCCVWCCTTSDGRYSRPLLLGFNVHGLNEAAIPMATFHTFLRVRAVIAASSKPTGTCAAHRRPTLRLAGPTFACLLPRRCIHLMCTWFRHSPSSRIRVTDVYTLRAASPESIYTRAYMREGFFLWIF
jgi:hypothetical protein